MANDFEEQLAGVAALSDPVRRRLYQFVVAQTQAVSRDEAAHAAGIKRPLAAFHLDKMVDEGLLEVEYRRLSGRTGPGAGRPSKLYRRSSREFDVTLPPRQYDVVGYVLATAIQRSAETGEGVLECVHQAAFDSGEQIGSAPSRKPLDALLSTLSEHGYEPRSEDGAVALINCPFHALSQTFTELVCGMNLALCQGLAAAVHLEKAGLEPQLQPRPNRCCVVFTPSDA